MSNFGFGFGTSDNSDDDRDDRDKNKNNGGDSHKGGDSSGQDPMGPFGIFFGGSQGGFSFGFPQSGGGEGNYDANGNGQFNPFAQLFGGLSGLYEDVMNGASGEGDGEQPALKGELVEKTAVSAAAKLSQPNSGDSQAVADAVHLAEMWINEVTPLPAGATGSTAFSPKEFAEVTTPTWVRLVEPMARRLGAVHTLGQEGGPTFPGLPEGQSFDLGPLTNILASLEATSRSHMLGGMIASIAGDVVHATEWGLPLAEDSTVAAIATAHLPKLSEQLGAGEREVLIYLAAREAAHLRLFHRVPWLPERLLLDVEEYSAGLRMDTSDLEEAMRNVDPNNPESLQEMLQGGGLEDFSPKPVSDNDQSLNRWLTTLSLVEGWVDVVVTEALADRIKETSMIHAAWTMRRTQMPEGLQALSENYGLELNPSLADNAAELWRSLTQAVGQEKRDAVWEHPDFLPVYEDLVDGIPSYVSKVAFDEENMADFDPIAEIEKLERERQRTADTDSSGQDATTSAADGTTSSAPDGTTSPESGTPDDEDNSEDQRDEPDSSR